VFKHQLKAMFFHALVFFALREAHSQPLALLYLIP